MDFDDPLSEEYHAAIQSCIRQDARWEPAEKILFDDTGFPRTHAQTRLTLIEQSSSTPKQIHLGGLQDLRAALDDITDVSPKSPDRQSRHLFVIEDGDIQFISLLGSRLRIPPAFFLSYLQETQRDIVCEEDLLEEPWCCFKMAVPQVYWIDSEGKALDGGNFRLDVYRDSQVELEPRESCFTVHQNLSFWSSESSGGWTAVMLLEATANSIRSFSEPKSKTSSTYDRSLKVGQKRHRYYSTKLLSPDPRSWQEASWVDEPDTLYDDLVAAFATNSIELGSDPRGSIRACQRLLFSAYKNYLTYIWRHPDYDPFSVWEDLLQDQSHDAVADLRLIHDARAISQIFRSSISELLKHYGLEDAPDSRLSRQWKRLQKQALEQEEAVSTAMTFMAIQTSARESRMSFDHNVYLSKLTRVALVLLPFTILTGIFSMQGDYAPDGGKFWVFWAIIVPMIAICYLFFFQQREHHRPNFRNTKSKMLWKHHL